MAALVREELHASVTDPVSASMNFLNEIAEPLPGRDLAGRRAARTRASSTLDDITRYLDVFTDHLRQRGPSPSNGSAQTLMQYGRTNGFIADLIARLLATDEGIEVAGGRDRDHRRLPGGDGHRAAWPVRRPEDVILAASPCYVGITGAARLLDIEVVRCRRGPRTVSIRPRSRGWPPRSGRAGRRPRALYLVPDFANPSGDCMTVDRRHELLAVAAEA